jgi:hypothetical protein
MTPRGNVNFQRNAISPKQLVQAFDILIGLFGCPVCFLFKLDNLNG